MRQPRWRKAYHEALRAQGIKVAHRQRVCVVQMGNTKILPSWLNSRLIPGLASMPGRYWLKHSDAMALVYFCKTIVVPYSCVETEFKRCVRCDRPLLGGEAEQLRQKYNGVQDRTTVFCGANCAKDDESGVWRTLGSKVAA